MVDGLTTCPWDANGTTFPQNAFGPVYDTTGFGYTVTCEFAVSLQLPKPATIKVTLYVPGPGYWFVVDEFPVVWSIEPLEVKSQL